MARTVTGSLTIVDISDGTNGTNGSNGISAFLTNENHTFPANETGVVADLTTFSSFVKVFVGTTESTYVNAVPTSGQFTITDPADSNGWDVDVNTGTGELTLTTIAAGTTGNGLSQVIAIVVDFHDGTGVQQINLAVTLSKAISGTIGSNGADAALINLTPSPHQIFTFDNTGTLDAGQSNVTLDIDTQGTVGALTATKSIDGLAFTALGGPSSNPDEATTLNLVDGGTIVISPANFDDSNTFAVKLVGATAGSDTVTITRVQDGAVGADGTDGESVFIGEVFLRKATAPTTPVADDGSYNFGTNTLVAPSTGGGSADNWSITAPTADGNPLYSSEGTFSVTTIGATDNTVTWSAPVIIAQDGADGAAGGAGTRGAGRFDGSVTLAGLVVPDVGSTDFNDDARQIVCEALQGVWTTSCSITLGDPVAGDVVVITYTDTDGTVFTRAAIHDGSGVADNDWASFAVQIDGSLLVRGTIVADELRVGNNGGFFVDDGGNLTARSITVANPPTLVTTDLYTVSKAVNLSGTDYICVETRGFCINDSTTFIDPAITEEQVCALTADRTWVRGCRGTDLNTTQPTGNNIVNGWQIFSTTSASTSFIVQWETAFGTYDEDSLVFDNLGVGGSSQGQIYACVNAAGCVTASVPGVSDDWFLVMGGVLPSVTSKIVFSNNKIQVFEAGTEVITLGDLT